MEVSVPAPQHPLQPRARPRSRGRSPRPTCGPRVASALGHPLVRCSGKSLTRAAPARSPGASGAVSWAHGRASRRTPIRSSAAPAAGDLLGRAGPVAGRRAPRLAVARRRDGPPAALPGRRRDLLRRPDRAGRAARPTKRCCRSPRPTAAASSTCASRSATTACPPGREIVARVLAMIDDALEAGHVVYLHCRAGIGRSATGGRLLARRAAASVDDDPLERAAGAAGSSRRARVAGRSCRRPTSRRSSCATGRRRVRRGRGACRGAATARPRRIASAARCSGSRSATRPVRRARPDARATGDWTQHTALALCLAESLLEHGPLRCARPDRALPALAARRPPLGARDCPGSATRRRRAGARHLPVAGPADGGLARSARSQHGQPAARA